MKLKQLMTQFYLLPKPPYAQLDFSLKDPYKKEMYGLLAKVNAKHVKRFEFAFDPFRTDCASCRNLLWHFSSKRIRESNPDCSLKSTVLSDGSDSTLRVKLTNGQEIEYKTHNLNEVEILQHLSGILTKLDEPKSTI